MQRTVKLVSLMWLAGLLAVGPAAAQPSAEKNDGPPRLGFGNQFSPDTFGEPSTKPGRELSLSAEFKIRSGTSEGILSATATPEPGWYTYSITQPRGGGLPSKLTVAKSDEYEVDAANFKSSRPPTIVNDPNFNVPLEEHKKAVTWTAPLRLSEAVEPESLKIQVSYTGQVCSDAGVCIPINDRKVTASFAGYFGSPPATANSGTGDASQQGESTAVGEYRASRSHVLIKGYVEPKVAASGDTVKLVLTAVPDSRFHVYRLADTEVEDTIAKPTLIAVASSLGWSMSEPTASKPIIDDPKDLAYYDGEVSWTVKLEVPKDTSPGEYPLEGMIGYQVCIKDGQCDPPLGAEFSAAVSVGENRQTGQVPLAFSKTSYTSASKAAQQAAAQTSVAETSDAGKPATKSFSALLIAAILTLAFLATLILAGGVPQFSGLPARIVGMTLLLVVAFVAAALHQLDKAKSEPTLWTMLGVAFAAWLIAHISPKASPAKRTLHTAVALGIAVLIGASFFIGNDAVPVCSLIGGGGFAIWVVMKIPSGAPMRRKVYGFAVAALGLLVAVGIAWIALQATELPWEKYSADKLEKYRQEGNIVLVDFTADW